MSYADAWDVPVEIRKWWIERRHGELAKEAGASPTHMDPHGRVHGR